MKTYQLICLFIITLTANTLVGQTVNKRQVLDDLSRRLASEWDKEYRKAEAKALEMGWSLYGLDRLDDDGNPIYNATTNSSASATTKTINLRINKDVTGAGMKIGMWECCNQGGVEGGAPFMTHQDLNGRITIGDNMPATSYQQHASHVAGTLIGEPPSGTATRGMAYEATMDAYGIANDESEMAAAGASTIDEVASGSLLVSNHSYGTASGWRLITNNNGNFLGWQWQGNPNQYIGGGTDAKFGQYNSQAMLWDTIAKNAEYYLIFKSAGNDRSNNPAVGTNVRQNSNANWQSYSTANHPLGDGVYSNNGYDCIPTYGTAKNILTVGAVNSSKAMSTFSGWGPTDDGRIKPDICGMGVSVTSCDTIANAYVALNGTSMASPNVAGSLLLLQEYYKDVYSVGSDLLYMKAATLKALAINTADDQGNNGPDYAFGFGVLNADDAGDAIEQDAWQTGNSNTVIIEDSIMSVNDVFNYEINYDSSEELYITMVYHDHPGATLVNDLDLRLIQQSSGGVAFPWVLNPATPNANATKGDNDIDNVEHMDWENLGNPLSGSYTVRVQVEDPDTLHLNEPVAFSLIIRGIDDSCHRSIQHKMLDLPTGTYTAQKYIKSQAKLHSPGREVEYKTDGKIELKPGFHAKAQTSTGAGYFRTSSGTCN